MITRIYAVAINTFREAVRDKVLYGVLAFATAVLLFTLALAQLSLNQQLRVVLDVGLASISLFSVMVAIFLGSSLLYKEIERKTLYVILPKPIHRWEFLVGKHVGITLTGMVFIATMGAVQFLVTAVQADVPVAQCIGTAALLAGALGLTAWRSRDRTAVLVPWSLVALAGSAGLCIAHGVDIRAPLFMLLLSFGEVMVLAAVALLFSSFSTPFLTGVFTLGVWMLGRSSVDMATMKSKSIAPSVRDALHGLAHIVPNFDSFVPGRNTLIAEHAKFGGDIAYVGATMAYAVLYTVIILMLAAVIFRRRDFL
ncbi:MAG: ABC transporter permease subunit [Polyangiales bacterium]